MCLWELDDLATAAPLWRATGHTDNVNAVCFLPGERIALGQPRRDAAAVGRGTGGELAVWPAHAGPVWGVAATADGRLARLGRAGPRACACGTWLGGEAVATWAEQPAVISCVGLSPNGRLAVTGGSDGVVRSLGGCLGGARSPSAGGPRVAGHRRGVLARRRPGADRRPRPDGAGCSPCRGRWRGGATLDGAFVVGDVAWRGVRRGDRLATGSGDRSVAVWRLSQT